MPLANKGLVKWYDQNDQTGIINAIGMNVEFVTIPKGVVPQGTALSTHDPIYFTYTQDSQGVRATEIEVNTKTKGTVKWFNHGKKYGYIKPDQSGAKDVLFVSQVVQSDWNDLEGDDIVLYDFVDTPKGPQARWVDSFGQP